MATEMEKLGLKLDSLGWTLTYAIDPVDGSKIVVLDWKQAAGLVADYEEMLAYEKENN
ncbi:hypothetical protein SEA_WATERT_79 [Microbacterium phage WaterT]|nr:hypothetical protein SEA_WATERT_79 [Microbacterium phage WaterT]